MVRWHDMNVFHYLIDNVHVAMNSFAEASFDETYGTRVRTLPPLGPAHVVEVRVAPTPPSTASPSKHVTPRRTMSEDNYRLGPCQILQWKGPLSGSFSCGGHCSKANSQVILSWTVQWPWTSCTNSLQHLQNCICPTSLFPSSRLQRALSAQQLGDPEGRFPHRKGLINRQQQQQQRGRQLPAGPGAGLAAPRGPRKASLLSHMYHEEVDQRGSVTYHIQGEDRSFAIGFCKSTWSYKGRKRVQVCCFLGQILCLDLSWSSNCSRNSLAKTWHQLSPIFRRFCHFFCFPFSSCSLEGSGMEMLSLFYPILEKKSNKFQMS